jgi:MSHA pilin protein MshC
LLNFSSTKGFTLIELITVMVLLSIISITLFTRMGPINTAPVQSGRDDLIAALFFAQQQAMMRAGPTTTIKLQITSIGTTVTETVGTSLPRTLYSVTMPSGVTVTTSTFVYDKLGRTSAGTLTLTGSGNSSGVSARIRVEASGYAFAN